MTLKPSAHHRSWTVHVIVLGQNSFIEKIKENTSSRCEHVPTQKTRREERVRENERVWWGVWGERERMNMYRRENKPPWPFGSSFYMFFFFSSPSDNVLKHLLQGIFPIQRLNPVSCIAGRFFTS